MEREGNEDNPLNEDEIINVKVYFEDSEFDFDLDEEIRLGNVTQICEFDIPSASQEASSTLEDIPIASSSRTPISIELPSTSSKGRQTIDVGNTEEDKTVDLLDEDFEDEDEEEDLLDWKLNKFQAVLNDLKQKTAEAGASGTMTQPVFRAYLEKFKTIIAAPEKIDGFEVKENKFKCCTCLRTFVTDALKEKHLSLGHVEAIGQSVFRSYTPRKIVMDVFKSDDVKKSSGFSYQIYVIPWVNDKNEVYDISVGFTKFKDFVRAAQRIWYTVERECKNLFDDTHNPTRWSFSRACGSVRREYFAGNKMKPEESFSLELYAVSSAVATQLKWFVRQYFDSIRVFGTEESKFYLDSYNGWLKNHLAQFLPRLPLKTQKHVAEFGPSFGFENLAN